MQEIIKSVFEIFCPEDETVMEEITSSLYADKTNTFSNPLNRHL